MKQNKINFTLALLLSLLLVVAACGGGGGGGGGGNSGGSGGETTTVSGKVTLSSSVAQKPSVMQKVLSAAGVRLATGGNLKGAMVSLYNADHPEWLNPVAYDNTDINGDYKLETLTYAAENGNAYNEGDPIPAGNYTIIVEKIDSTSLPIKFYVKVQSMVKHFTGTVLSNDIEVMETSLTPVPAVVSMFGVEKNNSGSFGGTSTNVAVNSIIPVNFNVPMQRAITSAIVIIKEGDSTPLSGTWKMSPDLLTATFYPSASLTQGSVYTVTVPGNASSVYYKQMTGSATGTFTASAAEVAAPGIALQRPANEGARINSPIHIKSTKRLDINSIAFSSTPSIGAKPLVTYVGASGDTGYPYLYDVSHTPLQFFKGYNLSIKATSITQVPMAAPILLPFGTEQEVAAKTGTWNADQIAVYDVLGKWHNALLTRKSYFLTSFMTEDFYYVPNGWSDFDQNRNGRLSLSEFSDMLNTQFDAIRSCSTKTVDVDFVPLTVDATGGGIQFVDSATYRVKFTIVTPDEACSSVPQTVYGEFSKINNTWLLRRVAESPFTGPYRSLLSLNLESPIDATIYDEPTPTAPLAPGFRWTAIPGAATYAVVVVDASAPTLDSGWVSVISTGTATAGDSMTVTFTASGGDAVSGPYVLPQADADGFGFANTITKLKAGKTYNWAVLAFGTKTVANFAGGTVTDPSSDLVAASPRYSFTVKNNMPPFVVSTTPADIASGVSTTTAVDAVFSEEILASSLTSTAFTLLNTKLSSQVSGSVAYDSEADKVTFTPLSSLDYNTTYIARITTGIQDMAGNHMSMDKTWNFTTGNPADQTAPVTTASPAGGTYNSSRTVTLTSDEAATVCYSTNGSTPLYPADANTTCGASPVSVAISSSGTLRFFGRDAYGNQEAVKTEIYVIDTTAPASTASPAGGTFNTAQNVSLSANEAATIYYTTDGSTPTASSTAYSGPITINANTTLKFFAKDTAGNSETPKTETYVVDAVVPVTTASPAGGLYNSSKTVTLTASESATIYYTTNGSTPTTSSTAYSGPITVSATTTLKFFAKDAAGNSETVKSEVYTIDTTPPVTAANPAGGTYSSSKTVELTANKTATIYYTTDGTTPTTNSAQYTVPISINADTTLKFFAKDAAGNSEAVKSEVYIIDTIAPVTTASPAGGLYNTSKTVTLSASESATIYYTINGDTPTTSSTAYTGPITVSATTTLKFFAKDAAGNSETVKSEVYTIDTTPPVTAANPAGGTYTSSKTVELTANKASATIYYTTDGTTPTTNSAQYTVPISINADTTLKFFAKDAAGNSEAVKSEVYIIDTIAPVTTASPAGGLYNTSKTVTLSVNETATIYYTTDGTIPSTSSTQYSAPIPINATTTLKFFAKDTAGNSETVKSEVYTIDMTAPVTTATPAGGLYNTSKTVVLAVNEAATIYYTTDGTTPTTSSAQYTVAITINATTTLKYFAKDTAGNSETVKSQTYIIDTTAPVTISLPNGGTFNSNQIVTFATQNLEANGVTTYFTIDGSDPKTSGTKQTYTSGYLVTASMTIKYYSVDGAGNEETPVKSAVFTIDTTPPGTTASPAGGTYASNQLVVLAANEPATIYYTTDGSTPTTGSAVYTGAVQISANATLKYFAKDMAGNQEAIQTQTYVIDTTQLESWVTLVGGAYNSPQSVTINANTSSSTIYYTTDGTTPTNPVTGTTAAGGAPITLTVSAPTTTLKFFAYNAVKGIEASVHTVVYTIDSTAPVTTAAPAEGTYNSAQAVVLTSSEPSAIFYTMDGSDPTASSAQYSGPIPVSATTTLKFRARDAAGNMESVKTQVYTIDIIAPVTAASPAGGLFNAAQNVTLTASETSTIYYTTDGTEPTTSSAQYSGPVSINATTVLKFFARDAAGNNEAAKSETYTIDTTSPVTTASPGAGIYNAALSITLTANETSTIFYSTTGIDPTTASAQYTGPISIGATTTLKFFARDAAGNEEGIKTEVYTIDTSAPVTTALPSGGLYNAAQSVTLNASEPSTIYYTTDGSEPTTSSAQYSGPLSISATTVLKFFARDAAGNNEAVKSETYTIDTTSPVTTASSGAGLYNVALSITLTANETSTIFYTTTGVDPTTSSSQYTGPISISATTTLKFFSRDAAGNVEAVRTEVYTIDTSAPVTTALPSGGLYNAAQNVTLNANETATIYYTTDGTEPTTSSAQYSGPISISATTTLKFFARDAAGNSEAVKTETYTIDTASPVTTASPAAGTYSTGQNVTLTASETSTIYYTTDGTEPTTSSAQYSGPISISATTTLKFFARDAAGNSEKVETALFTIDSTAPVTTASVVGGLYNGARSVTLSADEAATICYTTDGTTPTNPATGATVCGASPLTAAISVSSTLQYFATDTAGNREAVKSQSYTIDTQGPTGSILINGPASFTNSLTVTLALGATDANGVTAMRFSNDNAAWSAEEVYAVSRTYLLPSGNGTKYVYVQFKDAAGNWSTSFSDSIIYDGTAPYVYSVNPANGSTGIAVNSPVTITFSEAMDAATVTSTTFTVKLNGVSVSGALGFSGGGTILTFTPAPRANPLAPLDFSSTYTVTLTNGMKDLAGNPIATTSTTFTTQYGKWDDSYSKFDVATWAP